MTLPVALCGITCGTLWNLGRLPVALCGITCGTLWSLNALACGTLWSLNDPACGTLWNYLWHFVEFGPFACGTLWRKKPLACGTLWNSGRLPVALCGEKSKNAVLDVRTCRPMMMIIIFLFLSLKDLIIHQASKLGELSSERAGSGNVKISV
ncbi:hypothetical protein [Deinococcus sp. PESE-13]